MTVPRLARYAVVIVVAAALSTFGHQLARFVLHLGGWR